MTHSVLDPTRGLTTKPRDANAADRMRRSTAVETAMVHPPDNALALCAAVGLPAASAALIRRLLSVEAENLLLAADVRNLQSRIAALETRR